MPLRKPRPELERSATAPVPGLTRQNSLESVGSPITPSNEVPTSLDKNLKINSDTTPHASYGQHDSDKKDQADGYPFPTPASAPATTATFSDCNSPRLAPSKDLAFLSQDPYADDEPFDKHKPIIPSRSGSVRSIMSTSSMQSLKRGLSSVKRKLTRRGRSRPPERRKTTDPSQHAQSLAEDGITPLGNRAQTYMMGPSLKQPRRVETYQVMAMAI